MKYNAKSADVLNEADAFEKRLRVSDFMYTQDQQMFGPSDIDWRPGDPLYRKYGKMGPFGSYACETRWSELLQEHVEVLDEDTYYGHIHRRMLDLYNDGERYERMRCLDCEVDWSGNDSACWMCGVESSLITVTDDNGNEVTLQIPEDANLSGRREIPWDQTVSVARADEMERFVRAADQDRPNYTDLYESRWRE